MAETTAAPLAAPPAVCCSQPTVMHRTAILVASMADPPRTTDRWYVTWSWQCMVQERHQGICSTTTDNLELAGELGGLPLP